MLKKAQQFAVKAHGDQRYGVHPYRVHLEAVASLLKAYGETAQVVGYLHDVIEDTEVGYQQIKDHFGELVADCVAILSDEPGDNRKLRKIKTYAKMARVEGDLELALLVKAADRLANVRACIGDGKTELLAVYQGEHADFQRAVYRQDLCEDLWRQLNAEIKTLI